MNPNIALQYQGFKMESPMNQLAQLMQLQGAQQQNQLGRLQLQNAQDEAAQRQKLNALAAMYARPGNVPGDGIGPVQDPSFDFQGYANALGGVDPVKALQIQGMLRKEKPALMNVAPGSSVFDPSKGAPVYTAPFKPPEVAPTEVEKLLKARDALPPNDPRRATFDAAITKATTHAPPVSMNNYGSPLPIDLGDGKTGYIQPPTRPGGPTQVLTVPGSGKPAIKPAEGGKPTEFEAKAGLYFKSMQTASQTLDSIEQGNGWRQGLAERVVPSEDAKTVVMPEQRQKYVQAQRQWIDSINRVRSGANLPELEYDRAVRTFFPTYGEGESIRQQKAAARKQEEQAMQAAAGKALPQGSAAPQATANDPLGLRK